jgi:hypothetical protein
METTHDANYTVYVRLDGSHAAHPDDMEKPLKTCATYSEAREVQRQLRRAYQESVIRFEGIVGGGD